MRETLDQNQFVNQLRNSRSETTLFENKRFNQINIQTIDNQGDIVQKLKKTTFINCIFDDVNFGALEFKGRQFENCNFDNATFSETTIDQELLEKAVKFNVKFDRTQFKENLSDIKFQENELKQVSFQQIEITGVDFSNCKLLQTTFSGCILNNVTFSEAQLINHKNENTLFIKCTFQSVKFRNAYLKSVVFKESDCYGADFRDADMRDVSFRQLTGPNNLPTEVESLKATSLAGSDLLGAKLPSYLDNFNPALEKETDAAKNARNLFIILISLCFTTFASMLFSTGNEWKFPLLGVELDRQGFLAVASLAITGVFVYFHLYLQKMWDQISGLPAIFPDGAYLWNRVSPWMFSVLAWEHIPKLKTKEMLTNYHLQKWASYTFGWYFPICLVTWAFWEPTIYTEPKAKWAVAVSGAVLVSSGWYFLCNINKSFQRQS